MPLDTALPYGLRDVKITPYDDSGALTTPIDLPNSQVFSFEDSEEFTELRGDDKRVAIRGQGSQIDWSLESGGISLEAWAALSGGNVSEEGTTPDTIVTLLKKTTDVRPYFKVEGQAISDSGGDFHCVIYKCRATGSLEGEFSDGEFWVSACEGEAIGDDSDNLYEFVQNETATPIA